MTRRRSLVALLLALLLGVSIAAPRVLATTLGEPLPSAPGETADDGGDAETDAPASDEAAPDEPPPEPGAEPTDDATGDSGPTDEAPDDTPPSEPSSEPSSRPSPAATAPAITLGDLLGASSQGSPFDAALALEVIRDNAPAGARAIEVSDHRSFRGARTYALREIRRWSHMPRLGIDSATVWMRFDRGERTPFAVATGRDSAAPRIEALRARTGSRTGGGLTSFEILLSGADRETGIASVELRLEGSRPISLDYAGSIAIGPFAEFPGRSPVLLQRGDVLELRIVDAAGNASGWRRVRLP